MSRLTQDQADHLVAMEKFFRTINPKIPKSGESAIFDLSDRSGLNEFYFDIDRRGKIEFKHKLQERYETNDILVRLDVNSPDHLNPDGTKVGRNHLHIYREGYADRWAFDLDTCNFGTYNTFQEYFSRFCEFCKIVIPDNVQLVF